MNNILQWKILELQDLLQRTRNLMLDEQVKDFTSNFLETPKQYEVYMEQNQRFIEYLEKRL